MSGWRRALAPLTPLYRLALAGREFRLRTGREPVRRLRRPVIAVGNLSTGGAGKTPLTIALAKALVQRGLQVDVLSRGYGRRERGAARVDPEGTAEQFGDEPLLIARAAGVPVYVAAQRFEAGQRSEAETGAQVHLLDDGFQHRQLYRNIDILLLNRRDWEDTLLPAGNLREPLQAARRANIVAIPAEDAALEPELRAWGWQGPVWRIRRTMEVPEANGPVVAFCGIARPEQFFAGLEAGGLRLAGRFAFRDHHRYSEADVARLAAAGRASGAGVVVTTEKDQARLGPLAASFGMTLRTARLTIAIQDEEAAALLAMLDRGGAQSIV